jgi:putative ABC transport system substrate-binding protein
MESAGADAGALIAYGPNLSAVYRRAAYYIDKILRGARPSDPPLEEPSVFDLVVNPGPRGRLT